MTGRPDADAYERWYAQVAEANPPPREKGRFLPTRKRARVLPPETAPSQGHPGGSAREIRPDAGAPLILGPVPPTRVAVNLREPDPPEDVAWLHLAGPEFDRMVRLTKSLKYALPIPLNAYGGGLCNWRIADWECETPGHLTPRRFGVAGFHGPARARLTRLTLRASGRVWRTSGLLAPAACPSADSAWDHEVVLELDLHTDGITEAEEQALRAATLVVVGVATGRG